MTAILATQIAAQRRNERVLPEYYSLVYQRWWTAAKIAGGISLVFFSIFTGLLTAVGGTMSIGYLLVPFGILTGMVLWLLPDVDRVSNPPIYKLGLAYLLVSIAWPQYIAVVLPGLPWITPARMVLGVLMAVMAVHFSQNATSRRNVGDILGHDKIALRFYMLYMATLVWTLPLAPQKLDTLEKAINQEVLALVPTIAVAWLLSDIKRLRPTLLLLCVTCIFTMLVAILENSMQRPPWFGYIPSFLQVDSALLETYLSPQSRIGDGRYRIRATFGIVIYYSQYLCLVFPLLFGFMLRLRGPKLILAALLMVLMLNTVWFSNSRTASLALLAPLFGTAGLYAIRLILFQRKGDSFKAMFAFVMVVGAAGALVVAIASSHRLQMYTIGGSQHSGSDAARDTQWRKAWAQVAKNPIGAGAGNSPPLVGALSPQGIYIVDSTYINLLVDYGPLGFLGFLGCLIRVCWLGFMTYFRAEDDLDEWAGPLSLGILSFVTSAYVISNIANNFIALALCACVLALHRRQTLRIASAIALGAGANPGTSAIVASRR